MSKKREGKSSPPKLTGKGVKIMGKEALNQVVRAAVTQLENLSSEVQAATYTSAEAAKRHPGIEERHISRLCLRGKWLLLKFGSLKKIPPKEKEHALFAKKVGKYWVIPVSELDRLFLS